MTVQPDFPHKVSQIRHDLDDLYELMSQVDSSQTRISGVLHRHNNRFEELQQTLDLHGGRLDRIEDNQRRMQDSQQRLEDNQDRMDGRLGGMDGRLDGMDGRLGGMDGRLGGMDSRLDRMDGRLDQVDGRLDRIEDNQHLQFEHLSGQIAEILSVLRGPAAAAPAPESER
ncbi:MAG TPA: hypothetical protein VIY28_10555 [Pseudonocardiaceae bacterium]